MLTVASIYSFLYCFILIIFEQTKKLSIDSFSLHTYFLFLTKNNKNQLILLQTILDFSFFHLFVIVFILPISSL